MFPVKIVLGFAWLVQLAVAQDYHGVQAGLPGVLVTGGGNIGRILPGTQGFLNQPGVFINSGDAFPGVISVSADGLDDALPGVPAAVISGIPANSIPQDASGNAIPGVPAAVLSGVPISPIAQVASGNTFQAMPAVSVQSAGVPVFTGQSGQGVFSLPTQQGGTFLSGQGGSFVGSQVLGQPGATGQGVAAGVPVQGGVQAGGAQVAGFGFASSVLQQQVNPTVTQTVTVDAFETLTDLVLHSAPVTVTQFSLITTTRVTRVIVPTPVNNVLALSTSVVLSPTRVTLTETKSDFRVVVRTSVRHETLTHTVYAITHVPFTTSITETARITSPLVSTLIVTSVHAVTSHHTVTSTTNVHGGYY